jgi:hypothetical protein
MQTMRTPVKPRITTRDYNMFNLIRGVTKAGVHIDHKKQLSRRACRGKEKMYAQRKEEKWDCSTEWTRPAEHGGDEMFDVYGKVEGDGVRIVKVLLVDEEDTVQYFNPGSFNEGEILSIQDALLAAYRQEGNH